VRRVGGGGLVVNVALLLFEESDENSHFLGRAVPHLDLVLRSAAAHLHRPTVHSQTTDHALELMIGVVCMHTCTPVVYYRPMNKSIIGSAVFAHVDSWAYNTLLTP